MEELEAQWTRYRDAHKDVKGSEPPAELSEEAAALGDEARRLEQRQKAFRVRLEPLYEALLLPKLLARVRRDSVCLILREGIEDAAIGRDMRGEDEKDWAERHGLVLRDVVVCVDGRSKSTISKDCGADEVGMDYEVSEEQFSEIPKEDYWTDNPEAYAEAVDEEPERYCEKLEYAGDHHGVWARVQAYVPALLIAAAGTTTSGGTR